SAASLGSTGKGQPPTPGGGIPCHAPGTGVGGGPSHHHFVVFLIGRVTAQEFPRETRPIEALQVVMSGQRPPIGGWWHSWSTQDSLHAKDVRRPRAAASRATAVWGSRTQGIT